MSGKPRTKIDATAKTSRAKTLTVVENLEGKAATPQANQSRSFQLSYEDVNPVYLLKKPRRITTNPPIIRNERDLPDLLGRHIYSKSAAAVRSGRPVVDIRLSPRNWEIIPGNQQMRNVSAFNVIQGAPGRTPRTKKGKGKKKRIKTRKKRKRTRKKRKRTRKKRKRLRGRRSRKK